MGSASKERLSGRSDDGLHKGRCERVEQIMVSLCLSGRAMHRRHDARKSGTDDSSADDAFRFCDSLPSNPRPRLPFAYLFQQRSPPSSYLIRHRSRRLSDHRLVPPSQVAERTLVVVLLVPELAACQSALTSPSTLRGVRIHRCQALKANYTFCCGPEGRRSLKHLTVYFVNCSKHIHTRPQIVSTIRILDTHAVEYP